MRAVAIEPSKNGGFPKLEVWRAALASRRCTRNGPARHIGLARLEAGHRDQQQRSAMRLLAGRLVLRQRRARVGVDQRKRKHLGRQMVGGCGKPYAREKEIAVMSLALERAGLPSAHLASCPDCRDRAQGFFRREIA